MFTFLVIMFMLGVATVLQDIFGSDDTYKGHFPSDTAMKWFEEDQKQSEVSSK